MTIVGSVLARLQRSTLSTAFMPEIDGLRFIAIGAVLSYHLGSWYSKHSGAAERGAALADEPLYAIVRQGFSGVQLFFVLSGFILALPFAQARLGSRGDRAPSLRAYFIRRLVRLEPPYVISIVLCSAALVVGGELGLGEAVPHALASAAYLHGAVYGEPSAINGVLWSLEIEAQFYVAAPLLFCVFFVRNTIARRALLVLVIVAFGLAQRALPTEVDLKGLTLLHQLHWFVAGVLLADLHVLRRAAAMHARLWDLAAIGAAASFVALMEARVALHELGPWIVLLGYAGVLFGEHLRRVLSLPLVFTIGGMCYSIYLYHVFIISAVGRHALRPLAAGDSYALGWLGFAVPVGLVVIGASAVLFALFEKPFMSRALTERLLGRARVGVG